MKYRTDFVSNSSSSSFIISKKEITKKQLKENLLPELYRKLNEDWLKKSDIKKYLKNPDWENEDVSLGFYESSRNAEKKEMICGYCWKDDACDKCEDKEIKELEIGSADDEEVYVVTNNGHIRFDWDAVSRACGKYDINYQHGYCD